MGSVPGLPANPIAIVCDTSSLVQIFAADMAKILHSLNTEYSVQPVVVEAVEAELRMVLERRHPDRIAPFEKAIRKCTIKVLSEDLLCEQLGNTTGVRQYERINKLGEAYYVHVQRGEAYTHAAADILGLPPLSNDFSAVNNLLGRGIRLTLPVLRSFDVFGFGLQTEAISAADCEAVRKELQRRREGVPQCFENCSFRDGCMRFFFRLVDSKLPLIGSPDKTDRFDDRVYLLRNATDPSPQGLLFKT